MSRYALVLHNKIVNVHSGEKPTTSLDWLPIVKNWEHPTDYPLSFYVAVSNKPLLTITDNAVIETQEFALDAVESIKNKIAESQKQLRKQKQLGSFMVGEIEVTLADREDSIIINGLPDNQPINNFKLGAWDWVDLPAELVMALKAAHKTHVDSAYLWERQANIELQALSTHDELTAYLAENTEITLS